MTKQDRIAGVLIGQAAGDALGAPAEFGPPGSVARFGRGAMGHEAGQYTDDTEQAVIVATARSEPLGVAAGLLSWYRAGPLDVGGQTAAVLSRCRSAADMLALSRAYAARLDGRSMPDPGSGNGSLMRTGPVALPFLGDRSQIAAAARVVSDLTHATPHDGDACVLWSLAIDLAVCSDADSSRRIAELVSSGLEYIPESRRPFWQDAIAEALHAHPSRFRPNGGSVGAFKAALSSVSHNTTFAGVVKCCVAIGGDTDTTSAIAGSLAGALHGASGIPQEYRDQVHGWAPGGGQLDADGLASLSLQAAGQQVCQR